MSLINQMLQDLDARRSDVSGGNAFGHQIRAVPERRRVHPAWWVAAALGGMLAGVIGFVVLRPETAAPAGMSAQLPLKLDIDLNAAVSPRHGGPINTPAAVAETSSLATAAPDVQPLSDPVASPNAAATAPSKPTAAAAERNAAPSKSRAAPAREVNSPPVPAAVEMVPAARNLALVPTPKVTETLPAPPVNKQFKELTPPQRAENEYRKAALALQQGKRAEAMSGFEQALHIDPKHAGARQALIGLLLDGKQQDEAVQKAREGLNADPAQPALAMILARLQLEKGELRPAIETLERTLPHALERPDYLAFLAALLQRDERHKQAVEHYLVALQKAPQNGIWWMGLGISLQAERRVPEALESFRRAKATNNLSPELLAFVENRIGQLQ